MSKIYNFQNFLDCIKNYGRQTALVRISDDHSIDCENLVSEIYNLSYFFTKKTNPGDRIILYKLTDIDWVKSFFAIILAGGVVVPIDSRASESMFADILDLTRPVLILKNENDNISPDYKNLNIQHLNKSYTKTELPKTDPNSPCEIIFTSGTWAKPKGVTLSQTNLLSNLTEITDNVYKPKENERFLSILPLAHSYEQMAGLLVPLFSKTTIYYLDQITPAKFRNALEKARPHYLVTVPRVLQLIQSSMFKQTSKFLTPTKIRFVSRLCKFMPTFVRRLIFAKAHKTWGGNLHTLFVGGAPLDLDLDRFFQGTGLKILIGYGMSETSPLISASLNQKRQFNEVGKPLSNLVIELNQNSEILVKGPSMFLGYWPDLKQSRNEFFNTQDIGEFNARGNLILKGRTKNLVVYPSGDKIFMEDIEHIATQIPGIEEACIVNIRKNIDPNLTLIYTGEKAKPKAIQEVFKQKLPFFVQIKNIQKYPKEKLPRTHTLKMNRKLLHDWLKSYANKISE